MALGDLFGMGMNPAMAEYLGPDQLKALQNQSLLAAGLGILTANAPGPEPKSLGTALAAGFGAGSQNYSNGVNNMVQQQLVAQKLREAKRAMEFQEIEKNILLGGQPGAAGQAPADGSALAAPANPQLSKAATYRKLAEVAMMQGATDKAKAYNDMADRLDPRPEWGTPVKVTGPDGRPMMVQFDKLGNAKPVQGYGPAVDLPSEVTAVEYVNGRPIAGTGAAGMADLKQYNESKAARTNTNVNVNNTPEKKGEEKYWEALGKQLPELEAQAVQADRTNKTLQTLVDTSRKGTYTGMLAPGAIGASQFLQSFGFDAGDKLANSREFQATSNLLVLDFMAASGGARGFTESESKILYDAFPKIIDSPQARERIAKMLLTRNNRIIEEYKAAKGQFESGIGRQLPGRDIGPSTIAPAPKKSLQEIFK